MTLQVWSNDVDVVIAESAEDAAQVMAEVWGSPADDYDDTPFYEVEDTAYAVGFEDDPRNESDFVMPENAIVTETEHKPWCLYITASTTEWAATGRGFLATSEY